jgi:hypothetical protein
MKQSPPKSRTASATVAVLVAALTTVTFLPALRNDFVNWDDLHYLLENPHYRGLGWANLRWMFTTAHLGHYMPVTWLTFGLDYVLWGMNPWGYHLTAILFQAANAVLFYLLSYRLLALAFGPRTLDRPAEPWRTDGARDPRGRDADWGLVLGAATAALVFSIHPLRVESVAWVTERKDLLSGLFTLLTVLAYLKAFARGAGGRLHPGWFWASVGLFVLALLSKSIAVGLPVVILALDFYPLRRQRGIRLLIEKAPFILMSVAVVAGMFTIWGQSGMMTDVRTLSIPVRLAILAYGLCFYLVKTVVPWPLSPLYELHYPVRLLAPTYLVPIIAVVAISAALIGLRRRWPAGLTIWTAYAALLLPVSGLFQNGHQIAADRFTYLPCLGWALLAGAGVTWCWRTKGDDPDTRRHARLLVALSATTIVALAALSALQIRVWRDSETLWHHAIRLDPASAFSHFHLAGALSLFGRGEEARAEFRKAIALAPEGISAKGMFLAELARELQMSGDLEGAAQQYRAALQYAPTDEVALHQLGMIYLAQGDDRAALDMFVRLLRAAPGNEATCRDVGVLSARLGMSPLELESCPKDRMREANGAAPTPGLIAPSR